MLLISSRWPVLLEIMEGRTPAVGNVWSHCLRPSQVHLELCPTFGQSGRSKVVVVHDQLVHLQRDGLHGGFKLHAAVEDEDVEAAVALQDLCDGLGHAVHVPKVQQHQLRRESLKQRKSVLDHMLADLASPSQHQWIFQTPESVRGFSLMEAPVTVAPVFH